MKLSPASVKIIWNFSLIRVGGITVSGPVTLKQTVYDAIFEDIIEGRYPPGSILTENGLM